MKAAVILACVALSGWALFFAPRGFYSGDSGVKFIEAHDLWKSRFSSRTLQKDSDFRGYARAGIDFERTVRGQPQAIYSVVFCAPAAILIAMFGMVGCMILPLIGGLLTAIGLVRLLSYWRCHSMVVIATLLFVLFGTPLFFYSAQFFEHSLATGLVTLSVAEGVRGRPLVSGFLVGLAAAMRPETYCAVPALGVAIFIHKQGGALKRVTTGLHFAGGALLVLATYWIFNRFTAGVMDPLVTVNHLKHQTEENKLLMLWGEFPKPDFRTWFLPIEALPILATIAGWNVWIRRAGLFVAAMFLGYLAWQTQSLSTARILTGLFTVTPLCALGLLLGPDDKDARAVWVFVLITCALIVTFEKSGTGGGLQLGARLLLPVVPVLVALVARLVNEDPGWLAAPVLLLMALSVRGEIIGLKPALRIAAGAEQAYKYAVKGPGDFVIVKRDWEAGVLSPVLLYGKDIFVSRAKDDTNAFRILLRRRDSGCVYVSPDDIVMTLDGESVRSYDPLDTDIPLTLESIRFGSP